eukprot:70677_1
MSSETVDCSKLRVAFIGGGAMARALISGFLNAKVLASGAQISVGEPSQASVPGLHKAVGQDVRVFSNNVEAVRDAEVVFLAVKPQVMSLVLAGLAPVLTDSTDSQLVVSIAAGIPLSRLEGALTRSPVIRVMPNTPALVGAMAGGYSLGKRASVEHGRIVNTLLSALGTVFCLPEKLLDAVTGLSGSGPAYVFMLIEAMADGGVKAGLPRDVALALAAKTVQGSAQMVLTSGRHPAALKDQVTSPAGTTIAGVHALEKGGFRAAVMDAVDTASKRAHEMGKL